MGRAIYTVDTSSAVALAAGTPKTILAVLAPSTFGVDLLSFWVSPDGVSPTAVPLLWELCSLTGATAGTNTSETATIAQEGGRAITTGFTAASAYTAEPTVLTAIKSMLLTPNGGVYEYEYLWPDTPDSPVSQGFALRLNAPAVVNVRAGFRFARC
jgi:hypothetical protein